MTGTDTGLFATGVYGIVKFVGCFTFLVFVVDSLGRRRSLLWTSIAQGLVMYLVGIYGRTQPPVEGEPVSQSRIELYAGAVALTPLPGHRFRICRHCVHIPLGRVSS